MATKSQEILLKGNTTNASAVPSSLKVREIAINALDRSLFTNDGNSIVKLYTGTNKWFDVNGNANNALKLGGILASEYINKEAFNSHINNSTIHITAAERTKWNNKWDYNEETIKAVKVDAAVLSDKATKLATARKIWGKYFDGSGNVSGDLTEVGNITASGKATIQGDIISGGEVAAIVGEGTPAGVTDYSALTGKPAINGVTLLSGNNTLVSLGIQPAGDYATNSGVTNLLADYATKTFISNNYAGKAAFNSHTADTDIHITSAERAAWNAKWDYNEAIIKAVKVTSASSADSVAWSGITGKPTTFTPSAHTHTASEISGLPTKLSAFTNDVGYITGITKSMVEGVLIGNITSHTHSYLPLSGGTITGELKLGNPNVLYNGANTVLFRNASSTADYGTQIVNKWNGGNTRIILNSNGVYYQDSNVKYPLIHSGNYNSYAPTLTGTGASGTWGISISGNAATATNADSVDGKHNGELTAQYFSAGTILTHNDTINTILSGVYSYIDADNPTGSIGNNCILVAFRNRDRTDNLQIVGTANDKTLYYRIAGNIGNPYEFWTAWRELIHSDNYNKYAPSLNGSGAYGTWGISISGNASTVGGLSVTSGNNKPWGTIPAITKSGFMDVGKHFEFHYDNTTGSDFSTVLACTGNYSNKVNLPSASGTLALTTDNVASATKLQTPRTIWGQPFDGMSDVNGDAHITGNLIVDGEVSALVA